jgi:hypothetical protein
MSDTQFLTAIVPAKDETTARSLINQMTQVVGDNLKGIRVQRGNKTDLLVFRIGAETQTIRQGEWSANAATLTLTQSENNLEMFAVQNARSMRRGNQILFSSESPTNVAVNFNDNEMEVALNAEKAARITLFVGKAPFRVLLDGKDVSAKAFSFNRSDSTMSLNIPSGQHDLKILFR